MAELWALLTDLAIVGFLLLAAVAAWAPREDLPWTPLRLNDPVGLATSVKFARAAADPLLCRRVLREGGLVVDDIADRTRGPCPVSNAVRLERGGALRPAGAAMTCPQALALAFWDRHVLGPQAQSILGAPVSAIEHYGTYACRKVYGRAEGRPSEHASANALDVAGFRLADGRRLSVAADFRKPGAEGRFLRVVRTGACGWFRGVLSPDYNAAHRDHLHLDFGPYRICR